MKIWKDILEVLLKSPFLGIDLRGGALPCSLLCNSQSALTDQMSVLLSHALQKPETAISELDLLLVCFLCITITCEEERVNKTTKCI